MYKKKKDKKMGGGYGSAKSIGVMPSKEVKFGGPSKPDYLDLDKDGNKKEPMKKAAQDKKEMKKKGGLVKKKGGVAKKLRKGMGGYGFKK